MAFCRRNRCRAQSGGALDGGAEKIFFVEGVFDGGGSFMAAASVAVGCDEGTGAFPSGRPDTAGAVRRPVGRPLRPRRRQQQKDPGCRRPSDVHETAGA